MLTGLFRGGSRLEVKEIVILPQVFLVAVTVSATVDRYKKIM